MEVGRHDLGLGDRRSDAGLRWKLSAAAHGFGGLLAGEIEMRHLAQRMDAGIGAAGALHASRARR